ncbi:MAG: zf-TFIIB domain-containing protein, partial [Firmicutes bacterium]|nr:zf-TFIIB domain-containing protein [Bacillota bacterium]
MRQAVKEEVVIDVCPRCRGIWLDHGELEKIMHEAKHAMIEYDEL